MSLPCNREERKRETAARSSFCVQTTPFLVTILKSFPQSDREEIFSGICAMLVLRYRGNSGTAS
jgi:hypothetical protein